MIAKLEQWLQDKSADIRDQTVYRAPNMLPDAESVDTFLAVFRNCVGESTQVQLSLTQSWALNHIGTDSLMATDWQTLLRTIKYVTFQFLGRDFPVDDVLEMWHEMDSVFTFALVEATKLGSDLDHATLLEHMVNLRKEMDRLNQNKSDFVAVAAHELRTPLTLLEGYASMMRLQLPADAKHLEMYLEGFDTGILRLRGIINDMLDVTMLEAKTFTIRYQQIYLHNVINLVCDDLKEAFDRRGVSLVLQDPFVYLDPIYGDPDRLFHSFYKIISNALKYTPDGGTVTIESHLMPSEDSSQAYDQYIIIDVRDTGIGIAADNLESIFEKFSGVGNVALHSTSKTNFKGGGPGLGLPIARGVIEVHGGRVWAESPGVDEEKCPGTVFHIQLPIRTAPPQDSDQTVMVG